MSPRFWTRLSRDVMLSVWLFATLGQTAVTAVAITSADGTTFALVTLAVSAAGLVRAARRWVASVREDGA